MEMKPKRSLNLATIEKCIKLCKASGIKRFRNGDLEFEFSDIKDSPPAIIDPPAKDDVKPPSDEEILMWSSGFSPDEARRQSNEAITPQ